MNGSDRKTDHHVMSGLDRLFRPRSIAVVGASNDQEKAGYHMIRALSGFPGKLYPVNPGASEIQGFKAYTSVSAIGAPVDLVALAIPAESCIDAIRDAGEAGAGAALIVGGGFEETGERGKALQNQVLHVCRQYGIRLLGPNTAGFVNPDMGVTVSFNPLVSEFRSGSVAVVSQSGAMNLILCSALQDLHLGISIGVGTGNAADVGIPEVLEYLAHHEPTRAIAIYLEGVEDGRRLFEAIRTATRIKPVVAFTVGQSNIGDFAESHTGRLIGSFALKVTALRQAGAVVAATSNALLDAVHILSEVRLKPLPDPAVGILTGQAGPAMVILDYLSTRGVRVPDLEPTSVWSISSLLPVKTYVRNPVDTARPVHHTFLEILKIMAADRNLDILVVYAMHEPMCLNPVELFRTAMDETDKPMIFGTSGPMNHVTPTVRELEAIPIPSFVSPDRTATAVWALAEDSRAAWRRSRQPVASPGITGLSNSPVIPKYPDETDAKNVLEAVGIAVPRREVCTDHDSAATALKQLNGTCAVKILSPDISHKTDLDGVHLDIATTQQLRAALERIDRIPVRGPRRYLVEQMAPPGLDMIIGGRNDPAYGPVVMLGLGGTVAEAFGDVSMRLAPLDIHEASDMIAELKTRKLFDHWRGGPRYDMEAVADALIRVGDLLGFHPEISEIDLNPVRVLPVGILVLDALIVRRGGPS